MEKCYECTAGYFCPGDGAEKSCVQNEETKHFFSYGYASECSLCPKGHASFFYFLSYIYNKV